MDAESIVLAAITILNLLNFCTFTQILNSIKLLYKPHEFRSQGKYYSLHIVEDRRLGAAHRSKILVDMKLDTRRD